MNEMLATSFLVNIQMIRGDNMHTSTVERNKWRALSKLYLAYMHSDFVKEMIFIHTVLLV